jgi:adenylate cyclase
MRKVYHGSVRDRPWQALLAAAPADTGDLLEALWSALAGELGLRRATLALRTLHPEVIGLGFIWERGVAMQRNRHPHGELESERFRSSPLRVILDGGGPIRAALAPGVALPFPVLDELRARGMTDYLALPLRFSSGQVHALTLASDRAGGFSDDDVRAFEELAGPLAACVEARETRRVARVLLDTYVGARGGDEILDGRIERGDVELIEAVVLSCDLRGFTPLSIELPPVEVVALLNEYFERVCAPIHDAGGEVVKFIGDGVLATFAIGSDGARRACEIALAAARAGIASLHGAPVGARGVALRMGAALHLGQVAFGNVGSRLRLDFTVIGQAVNLAARLSGLCARLERELLVSAQFAAQLPEGARSLGVHQVRGLPHPEEVFTY